MLINVSNKRVAKISKLVWVYIELLSNASPPSQKSSHTFMFLNSEVLPGVKE